VIDLDKVRAAPVAREPFSYFLAEHVIPDADLSAVRRDFPAIQSTGVYPLDELTYGEAFARLIEEIKSRDLEAVLEEKLGVDLSDKPLMITVRGHCHRRDGRIHTDSKDKVVTCLLYLNDPEWEQSEGRLRLLRNGENLEDKLAEIPPNGGTLVVFKRSDNSWHGHTSYEGPRRYIMFNWVTSGLTLAKNVQRHKLSARLKRLSPFG
jgi:hypothetical protein